MDCLKGSRLIDQSPYPVQQFLAGYQGIPVDHIQPCNLLGRITQHAREGVTELNEVTIRIEDMDAVASGIQQGLQTSRGASLQSDVEQGQEVQSFHMVREGGKFGLDDPHSTILTADVDFYRFEGFAFLSSRYPVKPFSFDLLPIPGIRIGFDPPLTQGRYVTESITEGSVKGRIEIDNILLAVYQYLGYGRGIDNGTHPLFTLAQCQRVLLEPGNVVYDTYAIDRSTIHI